MTAAYKPTGFPRGRPRKGEIRPPTPGGIRAAAYRVKRLAEDPEYAEKLAEAQRKWYWNNHERVLKQKRDYLHRKNTWAAAGSSGTIRLK
jgi:hypothetical protein